VPEDRISRHHPVLFVHRREVVDVDEHDGDASANAAGAKELLVEAAQEVLERRQSGQ